MIVSFCLVLCCFFFFLSFSSIITTNVIRLFYVMKSHFGFEHVVEGAFAYSIFATCSPYEF